MPTHFPWPSITCVVSASELRTTSGAALWPHYWDERLRRHQPRPYLAGLRRDSVEVVTAPILSVLRSWAPQRTCLPHGFSSDLMGSSSDCLVALQGGPQPAVLVAARPTPPPTGSPEMWVWRRRGATINDVWRCLEDFQASRSSAQNAITGAGRAARSAQCQSPRRMRSAAPAICHGNSARGTSGPPSRGVRQLPPRAPSPIRTGQGSAGRRFEDPRASANNMTVRLSAVPL